MHNPKKIPNISIHPCKIHKFFQVFQYIHAKSINLSNILNTSMNGSINSTPIHIQSYSYQLICANIYTSMQIISQNLERKVSGVVQPSPLVSPNPGGPHLAPEPCLDHNHAHLPKFLPSLGLPKEVCKCIELKI